MLNTRAALKVQKKLNFLDVVDSEPGGLEREGTTEGAEAGEVGQIQVSLELHWGSVFISSEDFVACPLTLGVCSPGTVLLASKAPPYVSQAQSSKEGGRASVGLQQGRGWPSPPLWKTHVLEALSPQNACLSVEWDWKTCTSCLLLGGSVCL